ncbi:hypothetical protein [Pusillimonas sp.]|uniref:hypothetical protein n=1 Tax=Pusillimonas sp. TaxID=3040095 RepID=UPI0037CC43C2
MFASGGAATRVEFAQGGFTANDGTDKHGTVLRLNKKAVSLRSQRAALFEDVFHALSVEDLSGR